MKKFKVMVASGDAHGPEVVQEAVKILEIIAAKVSNVGFDLHEAIVGKCLEATAGRRIHDETLADAKKCDAVLFGYEAPPVIKANGEVDCALLAFRKALSLHTNIRNSKSFPGLSHLSPLRPEIVADVDILTVREISSGAYAGEKVEYQTHAEDNWTYSRTEIERIARVAGSIAMSSHPPLQVTSADKAIMLATSRLWRRTVSSVFAAEFPDVALKHQLVDNAAMLLMQQPREFNGIILTENTFGDILSDELCVVPGSLGLIPSASLGSGSPGRWQGFYEPMHGPGVENLEKGYANPVGMILAVAMMLRYSFSMAYEAEAVEKAVEKSLAPAVEGGLALRTKDLGGDATCAEAGKTIRTALKDILKGE